MEKIDAGEAAWWKDRTERCNCVSAPRRNARSRSRRRKSISGGRGRSLDEYIIYCRLCAQVEALMNAPIETADQKLRARARRVIPGGMFGHMRSDTLPAGYPQFFERAKGCHVWDVNGRRYLDLMCSWGPIVLGHNHPVVTEAVQRQMSQGDCMDGPSERMVELAERFGRTPPHADWAMFAKNGTDATTTCVMLARAGTGRRKILAAQGAYHGAVPWCSPHPLGVTAEDRAHMIYYVYNDIRSLEAAIESAGADLAGVIVSAFRHDYGFNSDAERGIRQTRPRIVRRKRRGAYPRRRAGWISAQPAWELGSHRRSAGSQLLEPGHRERYALAAVTGLRSLFARTLRRSS